jgi:methionyl-tRNA formyltransferase
MSLNALFLGAPNVVSAGVARGWQLAGNRIAAVWYPERTNRTREFAQDRALAKTAPGVSLHGLAEQGGVAIRAVPPLTTWPEATAEAALLGADVVISVLFLDRIPKALLNAYADRVVNLHPSWLPAYRGRWPTFNMLWDRTIDAYGGMTLHVVTPDFDTGDVLGQAHVPFPADRNLSAYYMHLVKAGAGLLTGLLPRYLSGALDPSPQPRGDARQGNRRPSEARLASSHSAEEMQWLCSVIPQITPLRIEGADNNVVVKAFENVSGAPTGAPPAHEGDFISMDARDARVRLRLT